MQALGAKVVPIEAGRKLRERREERLVTKPELAAHFGVHASTIERWQRLKGFPKHKLYEHGAVRYRVSEAEEFMEEQQRNG